MFAHNLNFSKWNLVNSKKVEKNSFGLGINIYEDRRPIYLPVLNIEQTNLCYMHDTFNTTLKTYLLLKYDNAEYSELIKKINIMSKKQFYTLDENKNLIGDYLELLLLRKTYVEFDPKSPLFKKIDSLIATKKFDTSFEKLHFYFERLNSISYEVHNSLIN